MKMFILTVLCLIAVTGGNVNPHCTSSPSRSILTGLELLRYNCFNYKHLPTDLQNPESVSELSLTGGNSNLNILRKGDLFATNTLNLKVLTLSSVKIKTIEVGALIGGTNLEIIDLSLNEIETLNLTVFKDTPSLKSLRLDENKLKTLTDIFPPLKLVSLGLYYCEITSLHLNIFKNLEKLKLLWIFGNKLKTLDWRVLKPLKSLDKIRFGINPYHCDCKIKFLLEYLNKTNINYDKEFNYCASGVGISKKHNNNQLALPIVNLIRVNLDKLDFKLLVCPPTITSFRNVNLKGTLECEYSGHPEPEVKWIKNGTELRDLQTEVLNGDPDFKEFNYQFKQVLNLSIGKYECIVSNKAGSDSKTLFIEELVNSETTVEEMTTVSSRDTELNDWVDFKIVALTFAVIVLAVILISGVIYIAVRYSKTKARLLKTKIYREVKDNSRSSEPSPLAAEEEDYPPLLQNETGEPIYEVIKDVNGYEIPITLQQTPDLPPRNQSDHLD